MNHCIRILIDGTAYAFNDDDIGGALIFAPMYEGGIVPPFGNAWAEVDPAALSESDCIAAAAALRAASDPHASDTTDSTIRRAEAFIAGFEDDDTQEGIPELLADLRGLIGRRDAMRGAAALAMTALDMMANECTAANPGLALVFNRVIEETGATAALSQALAGGPDPWHLFEVECNGGDDSTGDLWRKYIVSAQSGSEQKAEELARAAVDDEAGDGWTVTNCKRLGAGCGDIFHRVCSFAG